jgi:hypothetical protein
VRARGIRPWYALHVRTFIALAALTVWMLVARTASAQTCLGRPSFSDTPWQIRVESGFSSDVRSFGPGILRGGHTIFGGVSSDLTGYSTLDQTAVTLGGTAGVDAAVRAISSRLHVCPIVSALHQFGPNLDTADISANVAAVGGRVGIVASENQTIQVIPTIGIDAQWERDRLESGGATTRASRTFTVTRIGVGFVLNRRTAIVPEVIEIYGAAAATTFRVTAAFGFGR